MSGSSNYGSTTTTIEFLSTFLPYIGILNTGILCPILEYITVKILKSHVLPLAAKFVKWPVSFSPFHSWGRLSRPTTELSSTWGLPALKFSPPPRATLLSLPPSLRGGPRALQGLARRENFLQRLQGWVGEIAHSRIHPSEQKATGKPGNGWRGRFGEGGAMPQRRRGGLTCSLCLLRLPCLRSLPAGLWGGPPALVSSVSITMIPQ